MSVQSEELSFAQRVSQFRRGLTRAEWIKLGGMAAVIIGLNVIGWFIVAAWSRRITTAWAPRPSASASA